MLLPRSPGRAVLLWFPLGLATSTLAACAPAPRGAGDAGLAQVPPLPSDLEQYDARVVERIQEAVGELEQDLASAAAWGQLGMVYEVERMRALALACYREATARAPDEPRWWYRSAICRWRQGEIEQANQAIRRVLELAPSYAPAEYRRGTFAFESGDLDAALAAFERARSLDPGYVGGPLGKARVLLASDRAAEALAILDDLATLDPGDRSIASVRAAALREAGRAQEAPELSSAPVEEEVGPHWKDPWEDEVRYLRRVPEELRVGTMVARGRGEEAVPTLERMRDEKPTDLRTLMQLAEAYAQAGRALEARKTFRSVIDLEPENLAARVGIARLRIEAGERELGMQLLEEALSINPEYGPALVEKARLLFNNEQYEPAVPVLLHALKLDQRDPELWNWLAWSQFHNGRWQEAEASFLAQLERAPERGDAWLGLAKTRLKLQRPDEAEQALEKAVAIGIQTPGLLRTVQRELERLRRRVARDQEGGG